MNIKLIMLKVVLLLFVISSCNKKEAEIILPDFVVAFENSDASFSDTDESKEIKIVFSYDAPTSGNIVIIPTETGATYGEDYTTNPTIMSDEIILAYNEGDREVSFRITKLNNAALGETKIIDFEIKEIDLDVITQGNTTFRLNFTEVATLGAVISPEVGGENQPNQVYVDLSSQNQTTIKRDSWDLGFYSGDDFRVKLNGSIFMGVAQLDAINLNDVSEEDVTDLKELIATSRAGTDSYFDDPMGDITKTAIAEVSKVANENKVYLLKLGFKVSDVNAQTGSVALSGDLRGWKKIRIILNDSDNYVLQYADLNDTSFKEIIINKNTDYNFTFFSFDNEKTVTVEPEKSDWDLNFTVFTNYLDFGDGVLGGYGFSDFIVTNVLGNVTSYEVSTETTAYDDFELENVDDLLFSLDQTNIGSNWRSVFTKLTLKDRFYVLKDADDNIYKIRFNALVNKSGERGYPSFDYYKISE